MRRPAEIRRPVVQECLPDAQMTELSDHAELREVTVTAESWADVSARGARFETVRLTRVSLARAHLDAPDLLDVIGTACDLSASELDGPTLTRVELHGC